MRITVKGLKEANARLKDLGDSCEAKHMKQVLVDALDVVRQAALSNVRALTKTRTGNLQRSLMTKPGKSDTYAAAFTKADRKVAPHAHLIEYGHRITRTNGRQGFIGSVAPRPFFRPALDATRGTVRRMVTQGIKRLIMGSFSEAPPAGPDDTGWIG